MELHATALRGPRLMAVLLYNLLPVAGVIFWGWDAFALILLYWLENIIVGVRTVAGMLARGIAEGGGRIVASLAASLFFCFHFGLFCLVHGMFVLLLFGNSSSTDLVGAVAQEVRENTNFAVGIAAAVLWQTVEFVLFLMRGEHRTTPTQQLMSEPYPRMVVLHVAIIFSGFALMMVDLSRVGVVLLALLKTALDLGLAFRTTQRDAKAPA